MRKLIPDVQKAEIEELSGEHFDALCAFGADMYYQGIIKGGMIALTCALAGFTVSVLTELVKDHRKNNKTE